MNKLNLTRLTFSIFLFLTFHAGASAQSTAFEPHDVKRMFIYHFIKYIEWPEASNNKFTIGVMNDKQMYEKLQNSFAGTGKDGKKYIVKQISSAEEVQGLNLLYIPRNMNRHAEQAIEALKGKPTLVITDRFGMGQKGSCINFKEGNNTMKFEMNLQAMQQAGLKVAGQLKQVAIIL